MFAINIVEIAGLDYVSDLSFKSDITKKNLTRLSIILVRDKGQKISGEFILVFNSSKKNRNFFKVSALAPKK